MLKEFVKKYKHAWVLLYGLIYFPWYYYLETRVVPRNDYYIISTMLDKKIPFIEAFVIPYLMWFGFMAAFFIYFFFTDVVGFYRLAEIAFLGFTIYLVISTIFPNGQHLRPMFFHTENVFIDMVRLLYKTDTPTNVFPSMHVYGTLCVCIAIDQSERLRKHKVFSYVMYFIAAMIILSTLFLKQHSIVDVIGAFVCSYLLFQVVYAPERKTAVQRERAVHHI